MPASDYAAAIFVRPTKSKPIIATPNPTFSSTGQLPKSTTATTLFDCNGNITKDPAKGFCKVVNDEHYIKYGTYGASKNSLLNPYSMYYKTDDENRAQPQRGSMLFEYTRVSEECFNNYMAFLQTKINSYFVNAERLIRNNEGV